MVVFTMLHYSFVIDLCRARGKRIELVRPLYLDDEIATSMHICMVLPERGITFTHCVKYEAGAL